MNIFRWIISSCNEFPSDELNYKKSYLRYSDFLLRWIKLINKIAMNCDIQLFMQTVEMNWLAMNYLVKNCSRDELLSSFSYHKIQLRWIPCIKLIFS